MEQYVKQVLDEADKALQAFRQNQPAIQNVANAGQLLAECFQKRNKVYSCGNGGSMCDAMHFAEELSGRFRQDRLGLAATAISDPSHISCVGNDYGYDSVFSRYVEAHGRPGDVLLAISTSGSSRNVLKACEVAKSLDLKIISLTGRPESEIGKCADIDICTPGGRFADRVQELHIKVIHTLIELVERHLFPDNYSAEKS
ncbi:SIS domain-containing protein [Oligoflexaceae bacterium]|nr:SIS domain-containing protein [Oligoflexaceae bacterium]